MVDSSTHHSPLWVGLLQLAAAARQQDDVVNVRVQNPGKGTSGGRSTLPKGPAK